MKNFWKFPTAIFAALLLTPLFAQQNPPAPPNPPAPVVLGVAIGNPVTGGSSGCVVFVNGSGNLACDSGFTYAGSNGAINAVGLIHNTTGSITSTSGNITTGGNMVFGALEQGNIFQSVGGAATFAGSCPVTGAVGGKVAGSFTLNGACAAGTIIIQPGVSLNNGYACRLTDLTTSADTFTQTAVSVNSATMSGTGANGDLIQYQCTGY